MTFTKRYYLLLLLLTGFLLTACQSDKLVNGVQAPDIQLNNAQGEPMPLSSVDNKVVLIDFWASWCKPCREAHPDMIELYEKYKNAKIGNADGFTIYSVSLDDKKENWLAAIEKDQLPWPYQVADLKGFASKYPDIYQFEQIPTYYLIDERGIIIGKNITYKWLEYELKRRMKS